MPHCGSTIITALYLYRAYYTPTGLSAPLCEYFDNELFSDCVLVLPSGARISVHRYELAAWILGLSLLSGWCYLHTRSSSGRLSEVIFRRVSSPSWRSTSLILPMYCTWSSDHYTQYDAHTAWPVAHQ